MTSVLGMLSWVSPWWAFAGIAAVALPLLAHLLSRTRYRDVLFPATRLVRQAVETTTRIERPRHLILMLLRWLLLLLVVAAFMRPQWIPEAEAEDEDQGVALIILIDRSASMQRTENGASLYDRAVREAVALIEGLDASRDVASVVLVGGETQTLLPEPTSQLQMLIQRLEETGPGYGTADWASARATAQRLTEQRYMPTQVVTISDQQGERPELALQMRTRYTRPTHHLRIDGPGDNVSVRLAGLSPYPPITGRPITAQLELNNYTDAAREVTLTTTFGNTSAQHRTTLRPSATELLELTLPTPKPGHAMLRVAIDQPDAIADDNAAGLPLLIHDQTRVLVLYPDGDNQLAALAQRLGLVLSPGGIEGKATPVIDTMSFTNAAEHIEASDTARLRTAIVLGPERADAALADALFDFNSRGGGVIALVGTVDAQTHNWALTLPVLPVGPGADATTVTASAIDFDYPALRVFEGPARGGLANLRWPGVDHAIAQAQARPILTSEDGRAIVVSSSGLFSPGRLIAINADLTPGPGGLLAEPAFVVLFNELCYFASPGPQMPEPARPGDPMPADLRNTSRLSVPDAADQSNTSTFTAPGPYLTLNPANELTGGVWVELDPSESDTAPGPEWSSEPNADSEEDSASDAAVQSGAALAQSIRQTPTELWPYLVLGALLIAACESLLLWRFASGQGGGR